MRGQRWVHTGPAEQVIWGPASGRTYRFLNRGPGDILMRGHLIRPGDTIDFEAEVFDLALAPGNNDPSLVEWEYVAD